MDALDESHFTSQLGEDDRRGSRAFAEEADAFEQCAVGNAGGSEDKLLAGSEVFSLIDTILVFDSHASQALFLIGLHDQTAEHVSVEAADRCGGDHAFGSAP